MHTAKVTTHCQVKGSRDALCQLNFVKLGLLLCGRPMSYSAVIAKCSSREIAIKKAWSTSTTFTVYVIENSAIQKAILSLFHYWSVYNHVSLTTSLLHCFQTITSFFKKRSRDPHYVHASFSHCLSSEMPVIATFSPPTKFETCSFTHSDDRRAP